ncbi:MAG: endonuclease/exonuclease/phosphatase family protein [Verrucomicrobiota bacterium]
MPPDAPNNQPIDRLLDRLVDALKHRNDPQGAVQKWLRRVKRLSLWLTAAYVVALFAILAGMEYCGEKHWLTSFLMFLPPQGWLVPLAFLTPWCLLFNRRACWLHLICVLWVGLVYMNPQWSRQLAPNGPTIKVLTNNIGQHGSKGPTDLIRTEDPDIIVLQEAGRGPQFARTFTNYSVAAHSEFTLLSKFPIKSSAHLPIRSIFNEPVAARFELDCHGQTLVVYNIHFTSPRRELESLRGLGFLAALFGREGGHGRKVRKLNADFWKRQLEDVDAVMEHIRKETHPVLIAGDFNSPDHGVIYHRFAREWTDAFDARGRGFGFTFPGFTRNPLTLFGPWLRLDYVYSGKELVPLHCHTEADRRSQHRGVVATFEFKPLEGNTKKGAVE